MLGPLKILIAENVSANQEIYYEIVKELPDIEIVACTDTPSKTVEALQELEPHAVLLVFSDGNSEKLVEETLRQMKDADIIHSPYIEAVAFQPDTYLHVLGPQYGVSYIFPANSFDTHWPKGTIEVLCSISGNIQRAWEASGKRQAENAARENESYHKSVRSLVPWGSNAGTNWGKSILPRLFA